MSELTALILGGGRGTRLEPLTKLRAKPAVPIAGKFRLIDIPISNCIHAGIKQIFLLTQFNTESLHRHIHNTYRFDNFSPGYIRILAAQQTADNQNWYQGTADAVRQNLMYLESASDHVIILGGDHLYQMDYLKYFRYHIEKEADITISVKPVHEHAARDFGILKANSKGRITDFYEKPEDPAILEDLRVNPTLFDNFKIAAEGRAHVASMGIYIFKKEVLLDMLANTTMEDFGREVIPSSLKKYNVFAYFFDGYWEDIGSIKSFFETHMELTESVPKLNFYDENKGFFTRPRFLPATKIVNCHINHSIVTEGAIILESTIENASIDIPSLGIGRNAVIKNSIIDLDVAIGNSVQLINREQVTETFQDDYAIRDGIIVIPKGVVIPNNTII